MIAASAVGKEPSASEGHDLPYKAKFPVQFEALPDSPNTYVIKNPEELYYLQPLQQTEWQTVEEARTMRDEDLVFGLHLQDRAWAMPWWVIKHHHAANLTLAGQPVLMTFCEVCSGSAAFVPVIDGQRHRFQVKGIHKGTHFIADDRSGSFWSPFGGEAFYGPLAGSHLERLPVHHATWAEWLTLYPDTLVADGEGEPRDKHGSRWEPGRPGLGDFRISLPGAPDPRLPPSELVVPVEVDRKLRVYPISTLDRAGPVVNDTLAGLEILILHAPGSLLTAVFSRRLDGEVLVFEALSDGGFADHETGSAWNWTGRAISGPLAGRRLSYVPWAMEEWYSVAASHPELEIFDPFRQSSGPATIGNR